MLFQTKAANIPEANSSEIIPFGAKRLLIHKHFRQETALRYFL